MPSFQLYGFVYLEAALEAISQPLVALPNPSEGEIFPATRYVDLCFQRQFKGN
ncbi:MAG: hypothetical protein ACKV1O_29360 [Saprospiraceae bacterium]